MRLALEILSLLVLIIFGLSTPYRDYANQFLPAQVTPSRLAKLKASSGPITPERIAQHQAEIAGQPYAAAATPAPRDNSWMWQRNVLDQPLKNRR